MKQLLFSLLFLIPLIAAAQVEHNFEMDPENTDCHLINMADKTSDELVAEIRNRSFRFAQEIRISRYRTPHQLEYFSCDGKTGYLLAEMQDNKYILYTEISLEEWQELLDARDVLEFYSQEFAASHEPFAGK